MDGFAAVPEWTEVQQKSGLDPLGLQAASVRLYQELVPGISNVTLRTRYYGLYAWLCRDYAMNSNDPNRDVLKKIVRRAEALYALSAAKATADGSREGGIAGILWAQRKYEDDAANGSIDFSSDTDRASGKAQYLRQDWGAFGAAYESQLREIGILGTADAHDLPVPTPVMGEEVAEAFSNAAGEAGIRFLRTSKSGSASSTTLADFVRLMPSAIHPQSRERAVYERLLFAEYPDPTPHDVARRRTLILALRIARRLGAAPTAEDMRWILYACADWNGKPLQFKEPELEEQRRRWWAYHACDMGRTAYEALLKWMLDVLEIYPGGLSAERLAVAAVDAIDTPAAGWPTSWRALVDELPEADHALSEDDATSEWKLSSEVMQAGTGAGKAPMRSAQAAIELLAVLHRRCNPERAFLAGQHGGDNPDAAARSFANELAFLEANESLSVRELLIRIFKERILSRHLWVAMRKLQYQRDYTFLVESDDGRLKLRAKDGPVFTNPRLGPALTFLRDIHLVRDDGLTKRGEELAEAA
jgi:hypothetical protein